MSSGSNYRFFGDHVRFVVGRDKTFIEASGRKAFEGNLDLNDHDIININDLTVSGDTTLGSGAGSDIYFNTNQVYVRDNLAEGLAIGPDGLEDMVVFRTFDGNEHLYLNSDVTVGAGTSNTLTLETGNVNFANVTNVRLLDTEMALRVGTEALPNMISFRTDSEYESISTNTNVYFNQPIIIDNPFTSIVQSHQMRVPGNQSDALQIGTSDVSDIIAISTNNDTPSIVFNGAATFLRDVTLGSNTADIYVGAPTLHLENCDNILIATNDATAFTIGSSEVSDLLTFVTEDGNVGVTVNGYLRSNNDFYVNNKLHIEASDGSLTTWGDIETESDMLARRFVASSGPYAVEGKLVIGMESLTDTSCGSNAITMVSGDAINITKYLRIYHDNNEYWIPLVDTDPTAGAPPV